MDELQKICEIVKWNFLQRNLNFIWGPSLSLCKKSHQSVLICVLKRQSISIKWGCQDIIMETPWTFIWGPSQSLRKNFTSICVLKALFKYQMGVSIHYHGDPLDVPKHSYWHSMCIVGPSTLAHRTFLLTLHVYCVLIKKTHSERGPWCAWRLAKEPEKKNKWF